MVQLIYFQLAILHIFFTLIFNTFFLQFLYCIMCHYLIIYLDKPTFLYIFKNKIVRIKYYYDL